MFCLYFYGEFSIVDILLFFAFSYFPFIYEKSGVGEQKAKYGSWFDYKLNPRSQIFRRDHSKVIDVQTLLKLMRFVQFSH